MAKNGQKWLKIAKKWKIIKQSFQSMMLYNGAKHFYI